MTTPYRIVHKERRRAYWWVKPVFIASMVFYLSFHMFHGDRGVFSLWQVQHEYTQLKKELAATEAQRAKLERRVAGMRDGSLDRDLLDEQLRRMLGMSGRGEKIILNRKS